MDFSHSKSSYETVKNWSQYDFSGKTLKIVQYLVMNPIANIAEISRNTGFTKYEVKTEYDTLKSKGFFRKDHHFNDPILGERLKTELQMKIDPRPLHLFQENILLMDIKDQDALQILEVFCELIPYIHSSSHLYSSGLHLFIQFYSPKGAITQIIKVIQYLQRSQLFDRYYFMDHEDQFSSELNMFRWNLSENKWDLTVSDSDQETNYFSQPSQIELLWQESIDHEKTVSQRDATVLDIDQFDLFLIREFQLNSKIKINDLASQYNRHYSTISKRLKSLDNEVFRGNVLFFDRAIFNVNTEYLITGQFDPNDSLDADTLSAFIGGKILPFKTSAYINDFEFMWEINCPASYITEFARFIWSHCRHVQLYQVDLRNTKKYLINPLLFEDGQWNTSKNVLYSDVIAQIIQFL